MTKLQAEEWLKGDRSMINLIPQEPFSSWPVRIAQADAAKVEEAYWVLRAYKEGLITETKE